MRETKRGRLSGLQVALAVSSCVLLQVGALCSPASATLKYGPLQLSGNLETQNLVRHSNIEQYQFIQNRNTLRLRVDWDWLQKGKLIDRYEVPFIERSRVFLLYRGVYDGFYDIAPGDLQHGTTRFDDIVGGSIKNFSSEYRNALKFENLLREAYIDFKLKDAPLSFRFGRQQVIWGESDQFRIMDIWNPLDVSWHFQQESWDQIRIPQWLLKGLWDTGTLGPLSNTFLEVVYNPGDFQPGIKADFVPRPWALPFPNALRNGQVQSLNKETPTYLGTSFNLQGTSLRQGDFARDPADASEIGARFHGVTPQGFEFAVNYLYGRGRGVGASTPFAVRLDRVRVPDRFVARNAIPTQRGGVCSPTVPGSCAMFLDRLVFPAAIDAEVIHPYMHIFGLTGNYFEGDFTQTVFRFETAYVLGEPFQTTAPDKLVPVENCRVQTDAVGNPILDSNGVPTFTDQCVASSLTAPLGFTKRDVWAGMIGFDRPTWIRWLNPRATWFISGQFFWNYTTGNTDVLTGNSGAGENPYFTPPPGLPGSTSSGVGTWSGGPFGGQVERLQDASAKGSGDEIRRWEHLITLAATSFYRGGTIVPFIANAWDPVNSNYESLWNLDYFYNNNFIITLQQKFFTTYGSKAPSNDPWFAGGRFHRRDETGIKLTYQF